MRTIRKRLAHLSGMVGFFQVNSFIRKNFATIGPMKIQIYTDGSCLGNPGPGAWAFLARVDKKETRKQGGEPYTTNNRMELTAVIEALSWLEKTHPSEQTMEIYSDSTWVISTITKNWKRKKNLDLWERLMPHLLDKKIAWKWVRGHNGHKENEDCDVRAQREALRQQKIYEKMDARELHLPGEEPSLFDQ